MSRRGTSPGLGLRRVSVAVGFLAWIATSAQPQPVGRPGGQASSAQGSGVQRPSGRTPAVDPFAHWAAVVVAGEWHAAGGAPTDGFDNARRDVSHAFEAAGFSPANLSELSVRPARYPREALAQSSTDNVASELERKAGQARDGCLFYLTTHGSPYGAPVGDDMLTPNDAAKVIGAACGDRPTVAIVSACYSGVFIPALARPNRLVLTAARRDRTSFGCGQNDRYPYFDDCILKSLPAAHDFLALADAARVCIAERERAERLIPPSQPQVYVGSDVEPLLKAAAFVKPAPASPVPRRRGAER